MDNIDLSRLPEWVVGYLGAGLMHPLGVTERDKEVGRHYLKLAKALIVALGALRFYDTYVDGGRRAAKAIREIEEMGE